MTRQVKILWVSFAAAQLASYGLIAVGGVWFWAAQGVSWVVFVWVMSIFLTQASGEKRLVRTGVPGSAKILSAKRTNTQWATGQADYMAPFAYRYELDVTLSDGSHYRTELLTTHQFSEGQTIGIRAKAHNRKHVAYDPNATESQGRSTQNAQFSGGDGIEISNGQHVEMLPNGGKVTFRVNPSSSARSFVASVNAQTTAGAGSGAGGAGRHGRGAEEALRPAYPGRSQRRRVRSGQSQAPVSMT